MCGPLPDQGDTHKCCRDEAMYFDLGDLICAPEVDAEIAALMIAPRRDELSFVNSYAAVRITHDPIDTAYTTEIADFIEAFEIRNRAPFFVILLCPRQGDVAVGDHLKNRGE